MAIRHHFDRWAARAAPPAMPGARTGDHRPRERPMRLVFFGEIAALAADEPGRGPIAVADAGGS